MAQSYNEIQKQIKKLQAEADCLRQKEVASALAKVKAIVQEFGLTPADVFGVTNPSKARKVVKARAKSAPAAKYRDAAGNTWVGRGPRPAWFKAALASGMTEEQLLAK